MRQLPMLALVATIVLVAIWLEVEVWTECRQDHSFMYCMRVLSK